MAALAIKGCLSGIKILELGGVGPTPFAGMLLADHGADVVKVDRPGGEPGVPRKRSAADFLLRGKRSIAIDLKNKAGQRIALELAGVADAIVEGFRPGVAERLGLGPEVCMRLNPRLVYGRMTGWGQHGPLAEAPGFDLSYVALAGALQPMGYRDRPPLPPLNLVGDFGGGGMLLAFGLLGALLEAGKSGRGQVVDASMVDGVALLMAQMYSFYASGDWTDTREANVVDGGAPFYSVYECRDGNYVAVTAVEPSFYIELLKALGLTEMPIHAQWDRKYWPETRAQFAEAFRTRTREQWCEAYQGTKTCITAVLTPREAPNHPHNVSRGTFATVNGVVQPAPAPRYSRTAARQLSAPPAVGENTANVLTDWLKWDAVQIGQLHESGALFTSDRQ
jgi:alpha-methylacyl-CoA racemase